MINVISAASCFVCDTVVCLYRPLSTRIVGVSSNTPPPSQKSPFLYAALEIRSIKIKVSRWWKVFQKFIRYHNL